MKQPFTNNTPLVSIIIPTFNASSFISPTINYIELQTYHNWELLLVDDCSTDNTMEIALQHAQKDKRIKVIKRNREPKGSLTCRNIGIENANGKYIIHFDADDIIEPFCLKQRVEFMECNPSVDYASFPGESVIRSKNTFIRTGGKWGLPPSKDILDAFLSVQYPFSVWNNIYRTSVFKNVFWDEKVKIYTDFSFIVPIIIHGFKHSFSVDSKIDYLYCLGTKSAMTSNFIADDKFNSTIYLFGKTIEELRKNDNAEQHIKEFKSFFILQMQRVFLNGSWDQVKTFYNFVLKYYAPWKSIRLVMIFYAISFLRFLHLPYKKIVTPIFIIMFDCSSFLKISFHKIFLH